MEDDFVGFDFVEFGFGEANEAAGEDEFLAGLNGLGDGALGGGGNEAALAIIESDEVFDSDGPIGGIFDFKVREKTVRAEEAAGVPLGNGGGLGADVFSEGAGEGVLAARKIDLTLEGGGGDGEEREEKEQGREEGTKSGWGGDCWHGEG